MHDFVKNLTDPKEVIDELRAWCGAERGRQSAIARHLGCSRQLITQWFNGRSAPNKVDTLQLKEFLSNQPPPGSEPPQPSQILLEAQHRFERTVEKLKASALERQLSLLRDEKAARLNALEAEIPMLKAEIRVIERQLAAFKGETEDMEAQLP